MWAALDDEGKISAWMHRMSSVSIASFWEPPDKAKPASSEIGGSVNMPYAIPHVRMEYAPAKSSVPVMWWRSVEHSHGAFVVESFLDELAAATRTDPLALRLKLLAGEREVRIPAEDSQILRTSRLRGVLEKAAAEAGWGTPLPPGRGRGIAGHFSFHSYVAQVAEVSVEKGSVRVHRVVAAVDCGQPINPAGIRAQVEGAIVYGLSAAIKGSIEIDEGRAVQSNFDGFDVMRISDMPVVEVHVIPSTESPTGVGEPGLPPVAPALANALFAATGKRIRRLPVKPEDFTSS
jgi:isoquinoline 1-oxidoreductase beta subunit